MCNLYTYRYSASLPPTLPNCDHPTKSNLKCGKLSLSDVKKFHAAFYHTPTRKDQDAFILKYCPARMPNSHRQRTGTKEAKNMTISYFMKKQKKMIQVCQKCFCQILDVQKGRIQSIMKT